MHNIEGDIRNCIEVANGDYNLSHLDEPMLKYYNELVAKARAFDKLVKFYSQKDEIPSDEFFDEMGYILKELADDER